MKTFDLRSRLIFSLGLLIAGTGIVDAQPTIVGSPNTGTQICPSNGSVQNNVYLQFNFGGATPTNYFIQTIPQPSGCTVMFNINAAGQAILQFSDKTEKHEFKIYNASGLAGTYTFNKIQTLQGIKGKFPVPGPYPIPPGYDAVIPSEQVGQCKIASFHYDGPSVYYQDASGANFGFPMLTYEWVVPKNWKVDNTVSDGSTPIRANISANITPDPLSTGTFKVRALNDYCNLALSPSDWFNISLQRPTLSLPLVSNVSTIACGSQPSITFTMQNTSSLTCINSYNWSIGNNWLLPGGTPAPATYTTSTNSITLIPACGKAIGPVSASITALGYTYPANNTVTVAVTQPVYSITGVPYICSGSTSYTINGLVCNSTLAWTPPNSNLATLSTLTSSPTTLTWAGISGNIPLTANVTSCGVTTPVTPLPIHVGPFTSSDFNLSGNNGSPYWCTNQTMTFGFSGNVNGTNIVWTPPTGGWSVLYNGGAYIALKAPSTPYPPTGTLSVSFTEPCGTTVTKSTFLAYSSSACTTASPCYTYSPNPTSSYLNVNVVSSCIGSTYIRKIELVSASTGATVYSQDYSFGNVTSTTVPTSGYPNGAYYLRIYDGGSWSSYTISIMH